MRGNHLTRPTTRSFDVFFDLRLNKLLSKHSRRRWLEAPSRSLARHCNVRNKFWSVFFVINALDLGRMHYICKISDKCLRSYAAWLKFPSNWLTSYSNDLTQRHKANHWACFSTKYIDLIGTKLSLWEKVDFFAHVFLHRGMYNDNIHIQKTLNLTHSHPNITSVIYPMMITPIVSLSIIQSHLATGAPFVNMV